MVEVMVLLLIIIITIIVVALVISINHARRLLLARGRSTGEGLPSIAFSTPGLR